MAKGYTIETFQNVFGETRYRFAVPSILHPGTQSRSLSSWSTKAQAQRAGRQAARSADLTQRCQKVRDLEATRNEIIGDAGRYWHQCPFTREQLRLIDTEIAKLERRSLPRRCPFCRAGERHISCGRGW